MWQKILTLQDAHSLFSTESRAVSANALAPSGLIQHLKRIPGDRWVLFLCSCRCTHTRHWRLTYQEDQAVQEQRVEESNGPGHLVGENHASLSDTKKLGGLDEPFTPKHITRVSDRLILGLTRLRVALSQGLRLRYRRWRSWKHDTKPWRRLLTTCANTNTRLVSHSVIQTYYKFGSFISERHEMESTFYCLWR